MDKQKLQIGHPLHVTVHWYDRVPEPPRNEEFQGEVIGWRESQLIVRVPDYAVLRFWKKTGIEVGNTNHERRGFRVELKDLRPSTNNQEIEIDMPVAVDTDA